MRAVAAAGTAASARASGRSSLSAAVGDAQPKCLGRAFEDPTRAKDHGQPGGDGDGVQFEDNLARECSPFPIGGIVSLRGVRDGCSPY